MTKLQYNQSTGKVAYNPTTGKAQMAILTCPCEFSSPDCPLCSWFAAGETPSQIGIKLDGVLNCSDDSLWEGNGIYCIPYIGYGYHCPGISVECCLWKKDDIGGLTLAGTQGMGYPWPFLRVAIYEYDEITETIIQYANFFQYEWTCLSLPFKVNSMNTKTGGPFPCGPGIPTYGGTMTVFDPCKDSCLDYTIWITNYNYAINDKVKLIGTESYCYKCYVAHTSDSTNKPGEGANWENYWMLIDIS